MSVNVAKVTNASASVRGAFNGWVACRCHVAFTLRSLFQHQTAERRDRQTQRLFESMSGAGFALESAAVTDVAAAVNFAVAVHQFHVMARCGNADAISGPRHGREVEHEDHEIITQAR